MARKVLFTRALAPASPAACILGEAGVETLIVPTIEIQPKLAPETREAISQLQDYDWVFLTSAKAVQITAGLFAETHARFPDSTRVCCVGSSTAEACRREGWPVHLIPDQFRAEGVLSALEDRYPDGLEGIAALVPQSRQARPALRDGLSRMGVRVKTLEVYSTEPALENQSLLRSVLATGVDLIAFSSPTTVRYFVQMAGSDPQTVECAVIGPVTAKAASENGFQVKVEASPSTFAGLAESILRYFS